MDSFNFEWDKSIEKIKTSVEFSPTQPFVPLPKTYSPFGMLLYGGLAFFFFVTLCYKDKRILFMYDSLKGSRMLCFIGPQFQRPLLEMLQA